MKKILLRLLFVALFLPFITQVKAQCNNNESMCFITIVMGDVMGDGWDGSNLQVYQGDSLRGTTTLYSGSVDTISIQVCPDSIRLVWNVVGQWNEDCYFEVFDADGNSLYIAEPGDMANIPSGVVDTLAVSCPLCTKPQTFISNANTPTSVSLQWTDNSTVHSIWQVIYGPTGFSLDNLAAVNGIRLTDPLSSTSTTINNLSADTIYDFYVRTICSSNDYSAWLGSVSVRPGSYIMSDEGIDSITTCGTFIYDNGGVIGDYSDNCNSLLTIFPSSVNSLVLLSGTVVLQSNDNITVYNGTTTSSPVLATIMGSGTTPVEISPIMSTTGPLTVKFTSNWSGVASGFELQTSCVDMPTCAPVQDVNIVNVTGGSAMAEWSYIRTLGDEPYGYEVEIVDIATNTVIESTTTMERYYLFAGLNENNAYRIKVRGICNNGDNGFYDSVDFETPCLVGGNVEIADGTFSTSNYPTFINRAYSYTQQIYDASEMNGAASINSISVEVATANVVSQTRTLCIYMGHTGRSTFVSANDNVPTDSLHLVYTGQFTFVPGWNTISFDSAFTYNGIGNLILAVDDNTGSFGQSCTFRAQNNAISKSIYYASNDYDPNPSTSLVSYQGEMNVRNYRNNVVFGAACETGVTCVSPDVYVTNIDGNEINLIWAPGLNESLWNIEVKESSESDWILEASDVLQTSYTITGLEYNTSYDIRITSLCGAENRSTIVSATTGCAEIEQLPFVETFDTWIVGNNEPLNDCWSRLSNYVSTSYAYPNVSSVRFLSDSNSIQMFANTSSYSALILPMFTSSVNSLKVSFSMLKTNGVLNEVQVGILSNPTDITTFEMVAAVDVDSNNVWQSFDISLEEYIGNEGNIAIMLPSTTMGTAYRYIDNIMVSSLQVPCQSITSVTVNNITATSAVVSWDDDLEESAYEVEYGLHGFVRGTGTMDTTSNTYYIINGLSGETNYDVYVYRVCSEADISDPSMVVSFTTPCAEMALPFTENFDDWGIGLTGIFNSCWNRLSSNSNVALYAQVKNVTSNSPSNSMFLKGSDSHWSALVLPKMAVVIDSLQLSFSIKKTSPATHSIHVGVLTNPANISTFVPVDTITITTTNTWQAMQVQLDSYTGADGYIAIRVPAGVYPEYYIDDIEVELIPSCVAPIDIVSAGFQENAIVVDWTEIGIASQWDVCYGPDGFDPNTGQGTTITGITSHPYVIPNLSINTMYNVYVRSICGAGDVGEWSATYLETYPGVYNLNTSGGEIIQACSARIYDDGGIIGNYSNSANGFVVIQPSIPGNIVKVSGTVNTEQMSDYLKIYDGADTNATILFQGAGSFTNINCISTTGPLTIQFISDYGTNVSGFDLMIQCEEVSCYVVQNLRDSLITASSATIKWSEIGSATEWEVEYGLDGFVRGSGTTMLVNDSSYTITNLQPTTTYDIYVRAICGTNDMSEWQSLQITTGICDDPVIVSIGDGTQSAYDSPFYPYYRYSYSQQIYTASEIGLTQTGQSMDLSSIAFQYINESPITRNISIYLGHTTDSVFASAGDWIDDSELHLVYNGNVNWNNTGSGNWVEIQFSSSFAYNGVDNLVVAIVDNTGTEAPSGFQVQRFSTHNVVGNKSLLWNVDDEQVDISSPSSGRTATYRNNIRLISCGLVCLKPDSLQVQTDRTSATLMWNGVGSYEVAYKETISNEWETEVFVQNTNTYTFVNLYPETAYEFRIRKVCDSVTYSDWILATAVTLEYPCAVPVGVSVEDITYSSAVVSWEVNEEDAESWRIAYGYGNDQSAWDTVVVTTPVATLINLYPSTQYAVYVQRVCNQAVEVYSEWSDVFTFSTAVCEGVTNVIASDVTSNSAIINWTQGSNQTKWEIAYGQEGFTEGNGTNEIVSTTPSFSIQGLESDMIYDVYVRNICDEGVYSAWSAKLQFRTTVAINSVSDDDLNVIIYPNPATNETIISVDRISGQVEFVVVDINGRIIEAESIRCEGSLLKNINVRNLAKGTYFIHIYNDDFNTTRKLVVK